MGRTNLFDVLKGFVRIVRPTQYARMLKRDRGYVYFQDFIPDNSHDIRVTYIFDKIVAFRREVRPGDFRASGSYLLDQDQSQVPMEALKISFDLAEKLKFQTAAFDFILKDGKPVIVEVCFVWGVWDKIWSFGYYDRDLIYHEEAFNGHDWMVDGVMDQVKRKNK